MNKYYLKRISIKDVSDVQYYNITGTWTKYYRNDKILYLDILDAVKIREKLEAAKSVKHYYLISSLL